MRYRRRRRGCSWPGMSGCQRPPRRMTELSDRIASLSAEKRALLARRLAGNGRPVDTALPIPHRRGDDCPLSFAQQRLWFLDQLDPASAAYNIPLALRLEGRLDVRVLEQ